MAILHCQNVWKFDMPSSSLHFTVVIFHFDFACASFILNFQILGFLHFGFYIFPKSNPKKVMTEIHSSTIFNIINYNKMNEFLNEWLFGWMTEWMNEKNVKSNDMKKFLSFRHLISYNMTWLDYDFKKSFYSKKSLWF